MARRVLVVGFDGATWELLVPYSKDGTMPKLAGLMEKSRWGNLRSTLPPVTAPAWASLATGKNPGKTGVFAFYTPLDSIDSFRPISSLDVQADTLPEFLERAGLKVHVINLPTFSYPTKIEGTVLGDILCPPEAVVNPKPLLEQQVFRSYRSIPNMSLKGNLPRYIRDIRLLEAARFKCAAELLRSSWDFVFVMFSGVDWVQHELYGELLAGTLSPATEEARGFFRDLDLYVGWFMDQLHPEDYLLLVSDHGFERIRGTISVNHWLMQQGYLTQKRGASGLSRLARRIPAVAIPNQALSLLSTHPWLWTIGRRLWRATAGHTGFSGHIVPNPETTRAFAQDFTNGIYINSKRRFKKGILDEEEESRVTKELASKLAALTTSGFIKGCVPADEVYEGPFTHNACDLVIKPADRGINYTTDLVIDDTPRNGHSTNGIYLLHGPEAQPGHGRTASIYDVFPTVLSIFGFSSPGDLDGVSMIGNNSRSDESQNTPQSRRVLTPDEEDIIRARLRALGYS